jgi:L-ascorbate metabolism protein UlaG (beta-lactamase superfamily)
MEITWLGHSAIRIRGSLVTIVTDPFSSSVGFRMAQTKADVVTISHDHPNHAHMQAMEGQPRLLRGPGEYEIANFYIHGIGTPRQSPQTEAEPEETAPVNRQINTVFTFRGEGLNICHLGDISRELSPRQAEELNQTEVLIVPVGGHCTLGVDKVAQMVSLIGPRIVIPVHYRVAGVTAELEPLESFLSEMGVSEVSPQTRLNVTATNLPRDFTVVALHRAS